MFGKFFIRVIVTATFIATVWHASAAEILTPAKQAYITDFESGKVLFAKDSEVLMKPASMAKIMTVFVVFQRLVEGSLQLDDKFLVSEKAWRKGGSKTFVEVGSRVSVDDLLHGVIVQSGNDAAIVLAEASLELKTPLPKMNYWAQKLGMKQTNFRNSTGWPDPDLQTSAKDLNILTTEMIKRFPAINTPIYTLFLPSEISHITKSNSQTATHCSMEQVGRWPKTGHTEDQVMVWWDQRCAMAGVLLLY